MNDDRGISKAALLHESLEASTGRLVCGRGWSARLKTHTVDPCSAKIKSLGNTDQRLPRLPR
jgi:hypothetical protein